MAEEAGARRERLNEFTLAARSIRTRGHHLVSMVTTRLGRTNHVVYRPVSPIMLHVRTISRLARRSSSPGHAKRTVIIFYGLHQRVIADEAQDAPRPIPTHLDSFIRFIVLVILFATLDTVCRVESVHFGPDGQDYQSPKTCP